jgi:hypothetical protein
LSSTTSPTPGVRVPRHVAWLVTRLVAPLVVDYFTYAARPVASARRAACRVTHRRLLCLAQARCRLLRLRRASGCLGTSRGSSHGSSSATSPRAGSSSTISSTLRVRVPRHVARLVAWLIVDYFASRRLVVDYFAYATRPSASARRAARRRLLRLRRASGCFGTSRGMSRGASHGSPSTTSPTPARPGASARRAAHHTARRKLLRVLRLRHVATLALLHPRRASRLLVSQQHWLYINYSAHRRDFVFWSHRVDHSFREWQSRLQQLVGINSD